MNEIQSAINGKLVDLINERDQLKSELTASIAAQGEMREHLTELVNGWRGLELKHIAMVNSWTVLQDCIIGVCDRLAASKPHAGDGAKP